MQRAVALSPEARVPEVRVSVQVLVTAQAQDLPEEQELAA
jgi:hypothetical protein